MGVRENFLRFGAPAIEETEIDEVISTMRGGWLVTGPRVTRFENDFSAYKESPHAVALNSCTAALHLSLVVSGIECGDEVITTPFTFSATVNSIIHAGGTPVLADIDPVTMNIDPAEVSKRITPKTKALLPVHYAGRPCEMEELTRISADNGLKMIEDCAHAIETEYRSQKAGTFGDFGCFSFYATKNIVTGEGGMALARSEDDAKRIRTLSLHGMSDDAWARFSDSGFRPYQVVEAGFKYNMMDLQAAIGIHQLQRIERYWKRRSEIWERYNRELSGLDLTLPADAGAGTRHAYHLYTIQVDKKKAGISRDEFVAAMTRRKIGVAVHYPSIPEHRYYRETFNWRPEDYPNAMRIGRQTVTLPLSAALSDDDVTDVISAVHDVLGSI